MKCMYVFLGMMLMGAVCASERPAFGPVEQSAPPALPVPERIYEGGLSQTKTYMHQFVESPDGTKYTFRYFPGENQPEGAKGENAGGDPCEIWICNRDLTGHDKAFTSPKSEGGHGSDVIVWVTDDIIYYAGLSYQISTGRILWQFEGSGSQVPLARNHPVNANKLYVGIRGNGEPDGHSDDTSAGSEDKGWYWLDPSSATKPELHLVSDMKNLVQHYGGSWENAEATYIHQNPSDTKLHVVVYDREKRKEFAFILNAKDGSIHSYLGPNGVGHCHNGHVLWVDDETLMAGNQHPGLFDLQGSLIRRLAGRGEGNHISISPDGKWWVADTHQQHDARLYRFGSNQSVVISGDVKFSDMHPSFSRCGRHVFVQGKRSAEPHMGVYRIDVSGIKENFDAYFDANISGQTTTRNVLNDGSSMTQAIPTPGAVDWALWQGLGSPAQRHAAGNAIGELQAIGTPGINSTWDFISYAWSADGAPNESSLEYPAGLSSGEGVDPGVGYAVDITLPAETGRLTFWGVTRLNENKLILEDANGTTLYTTSYRNSDQQWDVTAFTIDWMNVVPDTKVTLKWVSDATFNTARRIGLAGLMVESDWTWRTFDE